MLLLKLYWLPKLHKGPYKSRIIDNSSSCTTTSLFIPLLHASLRLKSMLFNIVKQFHKFDCGAVSCEKDKYIYLTPDHSLRTTSSSHSSQYCGHQTYSYALKKSAPTELLDMFYGVIVF